MRAAVGSSAADVKALLQERDCLTSMRAEKGGNLCRDETTIHLFISQNRRRGWRKANTAFQERDLQPTQAWRKMGQGLGMLCCKRPGLLTFTRSPGNSTSNIAGRVKEARLRWFGDLLRRCSKYISKVTLNLPGRRPGGGLQRRFKDVEKENLKLVAREEDAEGKVTWRELIGFGDPRREQKVKEGAACRRLFSLNQQEAAFSMGPTGVSSFLCCWQKMAVTLPTKPLFADTRQTDSWELGFNLSTVSVTIRLLFSNSSFPKEWLNKFYQLCLCKVLVCLHTALCHGNVRP